MNHQGYPWISSIATGAPDSTICRSLHGLVWIHIADIHHSLGQQRKVVRHGCLEEDFFNRSEFRYVKVMSVVLWVYEAFRKLKLMVNTDSG